MELRPGYKQTEVGVIPKEWEVATVSSIGNFTSGKGISIAGLHGQSSDYPVPVFGGNGIAGYTTTPLVCEPTVVIGRVGQKCGAVYLTDGPAWITDNALYPRSISRPLDIRYFAFALEAAGLNDVKNRNDLPLVTQSILNTVRIVWAPKVAEQRAIATALADVDTLLAKLDQLIAKKRDIKQAAMQQLLTGKKRLPGFSGEWEVKRLGDVAEVLKGNGLSKTVMSESGSRKCILYGELFTTYGRVISDVVSKTDSSDGILSIASDILIPGSTTTTGIDLATASALLEENIALGGDINIIRKNGKDQFDSIFMSNYLTSVKKSEIAEIAQGTTIIHLYGKDLRGLTVNLPKVKEQTAIASVLSDMDAEITALEARRDKTRDLKQGMMQELLTGRIRLV